MRFYIPAIVTTKTPERDGVLLHVFKASGVADQDEMAALATNYMGVAF